MLTEFYFFYFSTGFYLLATLGAIGTAKYGKPGWKPVLFFLGFALAGNTLSLTLRWVRQGHGPYVDFWEVISSGVWGYHLAIIIACLMVERIRPILAVVLPILSVMVIWNLVVEPRDALVAITFDTIWLPVHVIVGKIFIGCVVIASSISLIILMRQYGERQELADNAALYFPTMPATGALDELSARFMLVGFVFQTLMLIVGAIWAQDAWGRYWAWDPLETWSFLTWICVIFYMHLRYIQHSLPVINACLILLTFVLAFLTFYGVPFFSYAAHQGAV